MGIITKGMGAILKTVKPKSKSNWIKDKTGTITGVKPKSGKVPWYIGAGKNLEERAGIVKTYKRGQTIGKITEAEKKIKEGTETLKKLRTTGWAGKPYGKRGGKKYFPKKEGQMAHTVKKKK